MSYKEKDPRFKKQFQKHLFQFTTDGVATEITCAFNKNTNNISIYTRFQKKSEFGSDNNKTCAIYLGNIAEKLLYQIYNNVQVMPINNPGYDFICGKGYKIDVKSGCLNKTVKLYKDKKYIHERWLFYINKNKIADYFLCLAFDDRKHLNPQHVWLIPGYVINNFTGASIAISKLNKWSQYEQPLNKVITCCDSIR